MYFIVIESLDIIVIQESEKQNDLIITESINSFRQFYDKL